MCNIRVIAALGTALASGVLVLALGAAPAGACGCQKEYMLKKYGTVSALQAAPKVEKAPLEAAPKTDPAPEAAHPDPPPAQGEAGG